MKYRAIRHIIHIALLLGVYGCASTDSNSNVKSENNLAETVQLADSLIDIAPDSSLVLCRKYFSSCDQGDSLYAKAKLIEGNAYFSLGDLEEARKSMSEAKDIAKKSGDEYTLINATSDLGVIMRVSQNPDSALTLYNEALSMIGDTDYKDERAHLLTSIAILYANTGHLEEARDYADQAVTAARISGDPDMIMYASSQAGAIYNLLGDSGKALQLTREAIADARRQNLPRYELKALGHMIDIQLTSKNQDSVNAYLKRGEEIIRQFPETSVEGLGFLEEKYVALSAMGRYRESLAIQYHLQRLQSVAPTFMPPEKLWIRMARNYHNLNMPDSTAVCYERAIEVTDSLRGEETNRQLSEFYARFKTTEKELAIARLERSKAKSDMWLAITIGIALLLSALLATIAIYTQSRKRKEELRLLQSHLRGVEQERGRLAKDLHDGVCNDLYGIEMLLQTETNREELLTDIEKIRSDIRRVSHEMMPPALQDVELAEALDGLVSKLSHFEPIIAFTFNESSDMEADKVPLNISYEIYRICQELLGNIIRHSKAHNVTINLELTKGILTLSINHDGVAAKDHKQQGGVGLASVKERLTAIGATAEGLPYSDRITIRCHIK